MDKGFFGGMFDFNGDGKLDSFERAADYAAFVNLTSENEEQEEESSTGSIFSSSTSVDDEDVDDDDEFDFKGTGYSVDELEMMDDDERAEILLDAGLDADDYDF